MVLLLKKVHGRWHKVFPRNLLILKNFFTRFNEFIIKFTQNVNKLHLRILPGITSGLFSNLFSRGTRACFTAAPFPWSMVDGRIKDAVLRAGA